MSRIIAEQIKCVKRTVEQLHIRQSDDSPEHSVTHQYGFIKFDDNEIDENFRPAQYIRLALQTDAKTVVKFIKDAWHLPTPDLVISITGGAKYSDLSARLKKAFQMGIVSAAATTNAWIITAGTNAGVVKEVGEALNKYRYKNQIDGIDIPCIGIASWGYTAGKEQLDRSLPIIDDHETTKFSFNMGIDAIQLNGEDVFGIRTYDVKKKEDRRCDLEKNHTHFLLFDDGLAKADSVLALRADIEMYSRRSNLDDTIEGTVHTLLPIVMVLVDGGTSSVETICEALDANTPIVVVKRSGRAADLVADIHDCFARQSLDRTTSMTNLHTYHLGFAEASMRLTEINAIFMKARINNPWIENVREKLCRILRERHQFVTVFDFDNDKHHGQLEEAILEAVFNAAKVCNANNEEYESAAELRLALAWHNVDYARQVIFTDRSISQWRDDDLRQGLVDALRRGYTDFIELFLEYGITLEKLTMKDLEFLYTTGSVDDVLPLKDPQIVKITRDDFYKDYMKNYFETYHDKNLSLGDHAVRELYIWALFFDRFDFAIYLCSKTWNQSVALLLGAKIYRKAADLTIDSETKHLYQKNANQFDKYAAAVIDRCFLNDRDFAIKILQRPAIAFYNLEPLKLALQADCRAFLASKCVQKHLDNEWFGNINYKRQNINIRIFFCSLFFPLIPIFFSILPYIHRHQPFNLNYVIHSKRTFAPNRRNIRWTDKILYFYRAPIVRFYYNLIFFSVFLGLFSYVFLLDFYPLNTFHDKHSSFQYLPVPITEICLHLCIWGIIFEETRQIFQMHSFMEYFNEMSNIIDLTAIFLYFIGFITRFIVIEEFFMISKIVFGLDLILWYVRILHLFAAYEKLGPKLIMIFNTMKDLLFFVCFILIFLFGFSITSWSLIRTSSQIQWSYNDKGDLLDISIIDNDTDRISWKLLRDITNYGVWKVFAQIDAIESKDTYSAVAFVLAILFVTISNVLLLNVLVALFNVTIENVQERSHDIWRYQRFLLVNEFRKKSLFPPPFNTLFCLFHWILKSIRQYRKRHRYHQALSTEKLTLDISNTNNQQLKITDVMKRESAIAEDFWRDLFKQNEQKT